VLSFIKLTHQMSTYGAGMSEVPTTQRESILDKIGRYNLYRSYKVSLVNQAILALEQLLVIIGVHVS